MPQTVARPRCWFLKPPSGPSITIRRTAAIGDVLAATCVASKLAERGFAVRWQCHPDIHPMVRRIPSVASVEEPTTPPHINLDGAYESHPRRAKLSFAEIFTVVAGDMLTPRGIEIGGPTNTAPVLLVSDEEKSRARESFAPHPRPWIVVAARSNSHANRTIPDGTWSAIAQGVKSGTLFWAANHAPAPSGFVDLGLRSIDQLIVATSAADLWVGPDTGPMHIAAALKVPVLAVEQASSPDLHLSDQRDFLTLRVPHLGCLNCQKNTCPLPGKAAVPPCTEFDPAFIVEAINRRVALQTLGTSVSCVIPTFKAPAERLNRAINAVLPQVDELVITRDAGGMFPAGAIRHPKITYVISRQRDLGYGKNANHGVRHTSGQWLLLLNDDCFLAPDAVKHLLDVATRSERVGMVGHLLRYPDGLICTGGKVRTPGMRGWHLYDNRRHHPTIKAPTRIENLSGTSVLVRREAFYAVNGFDESFHLYAEDDDMALAMGLAGWELWYTPHATGIHEEAQTTRATGRIGQFVGHGNTTFENKWAWWWDQNIHRVPKYT